MKTRVSFACAALGLLLVVVGTTAIAASSASPRSAPPAHPAAALGSATTQQPDGHHVPDEILVKVVDRSSRAAIGRAARSVGGRPVKSFPSIGVELWKLDSGLPVGLAIAELARSEHKGAVAFAEPNWISTLHDLPNDPFLPQLWGLHNVGQTGGTANADIDAPEAWSETTGSASIVIAVLDTGIDYLHEDLTANLWSNEAETEDGLDTDDNGYDDDVVGWDFVNEDNDPFDDHGHGTHTSGTIGGIGGNGIGISGVNQIVKIMPLKVCSAAGYCTTDDEIEAVLYAASFEVGGRKVVRVSNNSYGGGRKSRTFEAAIRDSGALFVASSGNDGSRRKQYPAGYGLDNVLSVAATDHDDELAWFSNYGDSWVDLAAPGVDVLSTVPGDDYDLASGTSMAAPHVTGVVGLLLAQDSSATNAQIKDRILANVDFLPSLADRVLTGGRLNAAAALGGSGQPSDNTPPEQVTDLTIDGPATTYNSITLTWTAPVDVDDEGTPKTVYLYDVRYSTAQILSEEDFAAATDPTGEPAPQTAGNPETFTVTGLSPETTYYFALKTTDDTGNESPVSNCPGGTTTSAPVTAWTITAIDGGRFLGGYDGIDVGPQATPAVAYSDYPNTDVRFAQWDATTENWETEIVDNRQYAGIDLLYGSDGLPTITYGWGKLYAATKVGGKWEKTTVQGNAYNDVTSLAAVPGGDLAVAYQASGKNDGLNFAERVNGSWQTQLIDPGAGARYTALTYDANGHPAIAYSDDPDDDGWLSAIALARWDGAAWTTEIVEEGPVGYGVPTAITFEAGSNEPILMHADARLVEWNGQEWVAQPMDVGDVSTGALAVHAETTYATWVADGVLKLAKRLAGGNWQTEIVESGGVQGIDTPPRFSSDGKIYLVYTGTTPDGDDDVRVAWRVLQ